MGHFPDCFLLETAQLWLPIIQRVFTLLFTQNSHLEEQVSLFYYCPLNGRLKSVVVSTWSPVCSINAGVDRDLLHLSQTFISFHQPDSPRKRLCSWPNDLGRQTTSSEAVSPILLVQSQSREMASLLSWRDDLWVIAALELHSSSHLS